MADIEKLLSQMTLDEKISMLAGQDLWHTVPVPRLGIPSIKTSDGPNGVRGQWGSLGPTSALFPVGIALGATWNPDLVERVGGALADEVKAKGAHILLAPTVNIHRTPIAGRNFECYSEDPYLSGRLATAYIDGMQKNGAGACIKHFICNDQEFERNSMSSEVAERPLHEIYLEPFRLAIRAARPWALMSSYNRVNGIFASENDYTLKTILREKWGYDGLLMSDWFGTYTENVPAGGLDLEMPGPARWMNKERVQQALDQGDLTPEALDEKVRRVLHAIERCGAFDQPPQAEERGEDRSDHRTLIREAARETIVLLRNQGGLLPLDSAKVKTIALIGELARWPNAMGGGSSRVTPHYLVSPLDGLRARAGDAIRVEYATGCFIHKTMPTPDVSYLTSEDGQPGLTLRIYDNLDFSGKAAYEEVTDRFNIGWFDNCVPNVDQERFCAQLTGSFTAQESGLHTFGLTSVGQSRLSLDGQVLLDNWTETRPNTQRAARKQLEAGQRCELKIEFRWQGNSLWRAVSLGYLPPQADDLIKEAVELAKRADVAIVVAGLTGEWESEGFDRVNLDLPGEQNQLIAQVAAANPNTVVVLNAGSALRMPWAADVPTILEQWYNSQECGNALADVLFGDVNPSGKLPTTFPKRLEDTPAYINYPGENSKVLYGEGLFVGYRYYDKKDIEPLFPFGYGLSYTTFMYDNLKLSAETFTAETGLNASFDVRNTGQRAGKEIVQLYVHDVSAALVRPEKELKAFVKIDLAPGERKTVTLHLDQEAFWYYNPAKEGWTVESGEFEILVGASSRDIRLRGSATLRSSAASGARLTTAMTLRAILNDDQGHKVLERHFGPWLENPDLQMALDMTIDQIATLVPTILTPEKLQALVADLASV